MPYFSIFSTLNLSIKTRNVFPSIFHTEIFKWSKMNPGCMLQELLYHLNCLVLYYAKLSNEKQLAVYSGKAIDLLEHLVNHPQNGFIKQPFSNDYIVTLFSFKLMFIYLEEMHYVIPIYIYIYHHQQQHLTSSKLINM